MEEAENAKDDETCFQDSQSKLSVLNNAMKVLDILAQSVLNEEVRLKFWKKLSDKWSTVLKQKQDAHGLDQGVREIEGGDAPHGDCGIEEKDYHSALLLSFLGKAVERGGLQLKDLSTVLLCLHEASHSNGAKVLKGMQSSVAAPCEMKNYMNFSERNVTAMESFCEAVCKINSFKGRNESQGPMDFCSKVPNKAGQYPAVCPCHYPSDNKATEVPKAATVPRSENGAKLFQKLTEEGVIETSHVSQGTSPYSLAEFPILGQMCTLKGKEKVDISDSTPKDHASNVVNKETLSSCFKNSELPFESADAKSGEGIYSFADILKKGQKASSSQDNIVYATGNGETPFVVSMEDSSVLKLQPNVLERRLQECKFSIVGRLFLAKGDAPWPHKKLKEKLQGVWNFNSDWKCVSLGKGFFHLLFNSRDEWEKVWSRGPISLKPGVMRFQRWTIDFNPWNVKSTNAQVWCRFYHLPWALWEPSVIAGLASKVGIPIRFDKATFEGEFGHYARVLVDVDVSKCFNSVVHFECGKHLFEVNIVPENLPSFCHGCSSIGHSSHECRLLSKREDNHLPSKRLKEGERVTTTSDAVGVSKVSVEKQQRNKDPVLLIKGPKVPKWRKKTDNNFVSDNGIKNGDFNTGNNGACIVEKITNSDAQLEKVTKGVNIVEMVTDFSAQFEDHSTKNTGSDYLIFSNQFSVLQSEDEAEEVVQESEKVTHQEPNNQLCEEDEAIIPKLPHRWSDVLDDEDENEKVFTLEEVNATIGMATSNFQHSFKNMSEFRAQLDEVWIDREDRFDRDMCVEIEPARISPKCLRSLITHFPKKDNKVKIGFRQPKRNIGPP